MTVEDFAKRVGVARQSISPLFKQKEINDFYKQKAAEIFQLSTDVFTKGKVDLGDIRMVDISESDEIRITPLTKSKIPGKGELEESIIPVYDSMVAASNIQMYDDITEKPVGFIRIPGFPDCDFATYIFNNSMYPTLVNGCMIVCKRVIDKRLLLYGEVYYIRTSEYRICKRIQKSKIEGHILACSDNDELRNDGTRRYESTDVPLDAILDLYLVKGKNEKWQN